MNSIKTESFLEKHLLEHIDAARSEYSTPEVVCYDHVKWKHLENPYGASLSVSLRKVSGELVGRSFLQQRKLCTKDGLCLKAATITDLVIVPKERSAASLIGMTRAAKTAEGFDLVAHTSNGTSDTIYRKLFKFPVACTLTAAVLPLRVGGLVARYIRSSYICSALDFIVAPWRWCVRGAAIITSVTSDVSFGMEPPKDLLAQILQEFSRHAGLHFERSLEFLNWRFSIGPISKCKIKWVYSSNECLGYIAVRKVTINGLDVLVVLDSVLRRSIGSLESMSLKLLCAREAVLENCDAVFCLANMNNVNLAWWGNFPYFRIPDNFLPHSTPIFVHTRNECISFDDQERFFLTLADLDYF